VEACSAASRVKPCRASLPIERTGSAAVRRRPNKEHNMFWIAFFALLAALFGGFISFA
jgi:hypothetical protein